MVDFAEDRADSPLLHMFRKTNTESHTKWKAAYKQVEINRNAVRGLLYPADSECDDVVSTNLIHSNNQAMMPHIYARDPEAVLKPSPKVTTVGAGREELDTQHERARQFAATAEIVINHAFSSGRLKKAALPWVRSTLTAGLGILKAGWQGKDTKDLPIRRTMEDTRDDVVRLHQWTEEAADAKTTEERDQRLEQVHDLMQSIDKGVDVLLREGFVFDAIPVEMFRMDPAIGTIYDYEQARWMEYGVYMSRDEFSERFGISGKDLDKVEVYLPEYGDTGKPTKKTSESEKSMLMLVWERWDRTTNTVYTWTRGYDRWLLDPWQPARMGSRFYPFFLLGFHWRDGEEWPVSMVELEIALQGEYEATQKDLREHRKAAIPYFVGSKEGIDTDDAMAIQQVGSREVLLIKTNGGPVRDTLTAGPIPNFNAQMYDTSYIRYGMDAVTGLQDAARAGVIKAKTLGEAQIQQGHLASRISSMVDAMEDLLDELTQFVLQTALQNIDAARAAEIAGPAAFWPDISKEEIYSMVKVSIRAGSTGKPDAGMDREQWTQMLPIILQLVEKILGMRQSGTLDEDNPYVALLGESVRRFDDRMDISEFLPEQHKQQRQQQPQQPQQQQQQPQQPQQQLQPQQQQQLQQLQQQLQQQPEPQQ